MAHTQLPMPMALAAPVSDPLANTLASISPLVFVGSAIGLMTTGNPKMRSVYFPVMVIGALGVLFLSFPRLPRQ